MSWPCKTWFTSVWRSGGGLTAKWPKHKINMHLSASFTNVLSAEPSLVDSHPARVTNLHFVLPDHMFLQKYEWLFSTDVTVFPWETLLTVSASVRAFVLTRRHKQTARFIKCSRFWVKIPWRTEKTLINRLRLQFDRS